MTGEFDRRRLFSAACAGMFVFGIVMALLGTLFGLPAVRARLGVNLAQQGDIFFLLYAGLLLATIVVGPLLDRFGHRVVLLFSAVLVALALLALRWAHGFLAGAIPAFVLGLGGGGINTSANAFVSELYGEERGAMLNLLGVFYGVGALFIPLLAASLTAHFSYEELLLVGAILAIVCVLAYGLLHFPPAREAQGFSLREAVEVVRYPGIMLFALLLFFQAGNEAAIGGWTSSYAGARGAGVRTATWLLSVYWAMLMAGRVLSARLLRSVRKPRLVLLSGAGALAGCLILLLAPSIPVLAAGVVLTGLSFAGIFPTTLAIVGDRYQRFAGTLFGVLFSAALVGGMTFPWAIGHLSQDFGMRSGMVLPVAGAAMICALMMIITVRERASGVAG